MILTILRQLAKSILSTVSEGFAEMANSLGELNNKITVVENECNQKFDTLNILEQNFNKLIPESLLNMTQEQLDLLVEEIIKSEIE